MILFKTLVVFHRQTDAGTEGLFPESFEFKLTAEEYESGVKVMNIDLFINGLTDKRLFQ